MRKFLILLLVVKSFYSYSQAKEDVVMLQERREQLNIEILKLKDSINSINLKIAKIESKESLNKINNSSFQAIARAGAQLRKQSNVISDIILTFNNDKEITIIDYEKGYFEVCYDSACGYMNEVWINKNQEISLFLESKRNERLLTQKKKVSSINYTSQFQSKSNKSSSKSKSTRYKSTRTYYRGPRGGCYYINSNGNKTYVDRSLCN